MTTAVQKQYPLRYWMTLAYVVEIPNFLHFDPTGRTHEYGLFNFGSITDIAFSLLLGTLFVLLTLLSRQPLFLRKVSFAGPVWAILLANLAIASLLQPTPRITPPTSTGALFSLFRLGQWVLGFILLASLYSRTSEDEAPAMLTQMIVRSCWINIGLVWMMRFVDPSLAYVSEDGDAVTSTPRLGGIFIHPGLVALLAAVAFLHGFISLRGWRRVGACSFAFLTLALTFTRSAQVSFFIAFMVYLLFLSPGRIGRYIGGSILIVGTAVAAGSRNLLMAYVTRGGQQVKDVESFDGRTDIWIVSLNAFFKRPFIGYGYMSGPRNVLRDNWAETHWLPPNAHNEFIQALLSGGVLTAGLILWMYGYILWLGAKTAKSSEERTLFYLIWIQLTIISVISTNLTTGFSRAGAFLVAAFLVLYADRAPVAGRTPAVLRTSSVGQSLSLHGRLHTSARH